MEAIKQNILDEEFLRLIFSEGFGYSATELDEILQTSRTCINKLKKGLLEDYEEAIPSGYVKNNYGIIDKRFNRSDNFLRYFFLNLRLE